MYIYRSMVMTIGTPRSFSMHPGVLLGLKIAFVAIATLAVAVLLIAGLLAWMIAPDPRVSQSRRGSNAFTAFYESQSLSINAQIIAKLYPGNHLVQPWIWDEPRIEMPDSGTIRVCWLGEDEAHVYLEEAGYLIREGGREPINTGQVVEDFGGLRVRFFVRNAKGYACAGGRDDSL